jgi:drug/metabolite transporter (DMT)-like permease
MTRLRSDLTLLLVALVWGSTFAAQRAASAWVGPLTFNAMRFFLGALLIFLISRFTPGEGVLSAWPRRKAIFWVGATGTLLFGASALQQIGLHYTTAGNAGFLTSLYVVLVPLVLLAFSKGENWRASRALRVTVPESDLPTLVTWIAVAISAVGVFLLSGAGGVQASANLQSLGDGLEIVGALFWALHVILVGRLVQRIPVMPFMIGQFLVCGALNLAAGLIFEGWSSAAVFQARWAILYSGVLSIGVGFTLQGVGQRHAPPTDAALILSMEAVFAALAGFLYLGELLDARQALGCGLILAAILLAQIKRLPFRVKAT